MDTKSEKALEWKEDYLRSEMEEEETFADPCRCDLCNAVQEKEKAHLSPDGGGYYCNDCFICGDVESYLSRHYQDFDMTKNDMTLYLVNCSIKNHNP